MAAQLLECDAVELKGLSFIGKLDPSLQKAVKDHFSSAMTGAEVVSIEIKLPAGDNILQMRTSALDRVDDTKGYVTALTDITVRKLFESEQRRIQRELARERAQLQQIIDQMPAGLVLAEAPSGEVVLQNSESERLMGISVLSFNAIKDYVQLNFSDEQGRLMAAEQYPLSRALIEGETIKNKKVLRKINEGQVQVLSINAAPINDEQDLRVAAMVTMVDISEQESNRRKLKELNDHLEEKVAKRTAELEAQTIKQQEANTALKVLLDNRDQERRSLEETVLANVNLLVKPVLVGLRQTKTPEVRDSLLQALEKHLDDLTSSFTPLLTSAEYQLSPRELEVAGLIKSGRTSDEIADILGISLNSVLFHRNNIRGKMGLKGKRIRLVNHLQSITRPGFTEGRK